MKRMTIDEIKKVQLDILIYVDKICKDNDINYSLAYGTLIGAVRHKGFIPWDDDIDIVLIRYEYEKLLDVLKKDNNPKYKTFSMKDEGYFYPYAKVSDLNTRITEKNWPDYKNLGVNIDIFPVDYLPIKREKEHYDKTMYYVSCLHNCLTNIAYTHKNIAIRIIKRILRFRIVKRCRQVDEWYWKNKINEMTRIPESKSMACIVDGDYCVWDKSIFDKYIKIDFEKHDFNAVENYDTMMREYYGEYMELPDKKERVSNHDFVAYWK